MTSDCIFCRIVAGEIPSRRVYEDEHVIAFRDIHPQAPVHVLVVPREHVESLAHLQPEQAALASAMMLAAARVAAGEGLERGFRVIVNTGPEGGQTVGHLHLHVLGGRAFSEGMLRD